MARPRRIDVHGGIHHVMNRGVDRQTVFHDDHSRIDFGRRLAFVHGEFRVETLAYCLMGNHFHLLLHTPDAGLSVAMQHIGSVFTRHQNDRLGRDGPLFRGRFNSLLVTTDLYLRWLVRYIHRNPVEAGLVHNACEYRWSSCRAYAGLRPTATFLDTDRVLGLFDGDRARLAAFTDGSDDGLASHCEFGGADLRQLIEFAIARDDIDHDDEANRTWLARTILTLLAHESDDARISHLSGELLAFPTGAARRMALSRARQRRLADPAIGRVLDTVGRDLAVPRRAA